MVGKVAKTRNASQLRARLAASKGVGRHGAYAINLSDLIDQACSCQFLSLAVVPLCSLGTLDPIAHSHQGSFWAEEFATWMGVQIQTVQEVAGSNERM